MNFFKSLGLFFGVLTIVSAKSHSPSHKVENEFQTVQDSYQHVLECLTDLDLAHLETLTHVDSMCLNKCVLEREGIIHKHKLEVDSNKFEKYSEKMNINNPGQRHYLRNCLEESLDEFKIKECEHMSTLTSCFLKAKVKGALTNALYQIFENFREWLGFSGPLQFKEEGSYERMKYIGKGSIKLHQ